MWLLYYSVFCIIHLMIHSQSPKCLRLYCVGLIIATENLFCLIFQPLLPHHLYRASLFTKANSVSYPKSSVLLISISFVKRLDWTAADDSLQAGSSQVWNRREKVQKHSVAADIDQIFTCFFLLFCGLPSRMSLLFWIDFRSFPNLSIVLAQRPTRPDRAYFDWYF